MDVGGSSASPRGVIAPESANNALTGGALVPTLALGIPGDAVTAGMMSTLIMQGIQPECVCLWIIPRSSMPPS